jgi:hypothetical protein
MITTLYDIVSAVNHKEKRHDVNKTNLSKDVLFTCFLLQSDHVES